MANMSVFVKKFIIISSTILLLCIFVLNMQVLIIHMTDSDLCFNIVEYFSSNPSFFRTVIYVEYLYEFRYYLLLCHLLMALLHAYGLLLHIKEKSVITPGICTIISLITATLLLLVFALVVLIKDNKVPKKIENFLNSKIIGSTNNTEITSYIEDFMNKTNCCSLQFCSESNPDSTDCLSYIINGIKSMFWYVTVVVCVPVVSVITIYLGYKLMPKLVEFLKSKNTIPDESEKNSPNDNISYSGSDSSTDFEKVTDTADISDPKFTNFKTRKLY